MKRSGFKRPNYQEFLERVQAANARPRALLKRGRIKPRKTSKQETVDGDSERAIRDNCDEIIRKIVRLRDRRCFTCGVLRIHVTLHPGHYISRKILKLRWSTANVHAQCNMCNGNHNAHPEIYRKSLMREYDESTVLQLEFIAQQNPRVEYVDLLAIRDGLREELKQWQR